MKKFIYIIGCAISGERLMLDIINNSISIRTINELGIKSSREDDNGRFDRDNVYVSIPELGLKGFELAFFGRGMIERSSDDCVIFKKEIDVLEDKPLNV